MTRTGTVRVALLALLVATGLSPAAAAAEIEGTLEVASVWPDGRIGWTWGPHDLSENGRVMVFAGEGRLYRRDLAEGVTEELSVARHLDPRGLDVSDGGRFVAILDTEIVGRDRNRRIVADLYLHDVRRDATRRVLRIADRVGGAILSEGPVLGGGTRYLAFATRDPDFAAQDTNERRDVFVLDRRSGDVELVSATRRGRPGNGLSGSPAMTADGRHVLFASSSSDLVPHDTNGRSDIFLRDLDSGTTTRVNVTDDGAQARGGSAQWPAISADGSTVAFVARARSLDPSATDDDFDVFVRDLAAGTTVRLGAGKQGGTSFVSDLSEDGRYLVYGSTRPDITTAPGCVGGEYHVYLLDRVDATTTCLSPHPDPTVSGGSGGGLVSAQGEVVAFSSDAVLLPGTDQQNYVYLWRRTGTG